MKPIFLGLLGALALAAAGCVSAGGSYAAHHPELSAEQRKILTTGKIPDGKAVSGLTREQVRLAMRRDPAQFTKIEGQDAWVYLQEKSSNSPLDPLNQSSAPNLTAAATAPGGQKMVVRTTIFFEGDRAVRADVSDEKAGD